MLDIIFCDGMDFAHLYKFQAQCLWYHIVPWAVQVVTVSYSTECILEHVCGFTFCVKKKQMCSENLSEK